MDRVKWWWFFSSERQSLLREENQSNSQEFYIRGSLKNWIKVREGMQFEARYSGSTIADIKAVCAGAGKQSQREDLREAHIECLLLTFSANLCMERTRLFKFNWKNMEFEIIRTSKLPWGERGGLWWRIKMVVNPEWNLMVHQRERSNHQWKRDKNWRVYVSPRRVNLIGHVWLAQQHRFILSAASVFIPVDTRLTLSLYHGIRVVQHNSKFNRTVSTVTATMKLSQVGQP